MSNLVTATFSLEAIEQVVRKLADEKLVVTDDREKGKVSGDAIVDVAHEALIRGWKLLRGWLDEDRQNLRQQRWIEDRAIEWQKSRKAKEFLLSGRQLKESRKFQKQQVDRFALSELAQQLLRVSEYQKVKGLAFVAAIYMIIPIVLGGFAIRWWYLETKWAVLRQCEKEQTKDGRCAGRTDALRSLIDFNINLQGFNLNYANLNNANLSNAELSSAELLGAKLMNTNLSNANLNNANLHSADISGTNLSNANLGNAALSNANFLFANLSNANLNGANLNGAKSYSTDLRGADLRGANLSYADLEISNFYYANLSNADLSYTNLRESDLRGANLRGSNLTDIKQLQPETIKKACNWEQAKMSKELRKQIENSPNPKEKPDCRTWNKSN